MSENNRSYRIRTTVNSSGSTYIDIPLNQDYDNFEILSLKLDRENAYKMHTANYGCIAGRVLANGAYGIPNAKISVFIETEESDDIDPVLKSLYPYETFTDKNSDNIRYNTLPDKKINQCHQAVGTFPNKRLVLDDANVLEIYEKYYKYTAVSNESGDYMIFGVPVGNQTIHVDIDLSDIGDLSQSPVDFMYKGYNASQFESATMFKSDTELDTLAQIISENDDVYVNPFWGDDESATVSITRKDIDVKYKFEPTCIFIGSVFTDGEQYGITKSCIPEAKMGRMNQLTGKAGTIEMIRKTVDGSVESFVIKGNKLIDGSGTWCYQIPMNLDYMGTDEYGNKVATNDPNKGVPTRTRVRFRLSLTTSSSDYVNLHLSKVLIPNNPSSKDDIDYSFGSYSIDDDEGTKSFRDLFTNNVYTVKSYIPRIQNRSAQRSQKFSGIKYINDNNGNNPIPYNNMRVNLTFKFVLQCAILKVIIRMVKFINGFSSLFKKKCVVLGDGLCPELEGWYFSPGCSDNRLRNTLKNIISENGSNDNDNESADQNNGEGGNESVCLTQKIDYLMQCVEINLAMEDDVIQFDFYNDWLNGTIYIPRWYANIKQKQMYTASDGTKIKENVQACMEDTFTNTRNLVQQCALTYSKSNEDSGYNVYSNIITSKGCKNDTKQKCHKSYGRKSVTIFGKSSGGIVHTETTLKQEFVYYLKPCEWKGTSKDKYKTKIELFATDIVLLGSIKENNKDGIPLAFNDLTGTSYKLPGNLVTTNLENDTVLYATGGGTICSGKFTTDVHKTDSYSSYTSGTDDYDNEKEIADEYKISDISGIDWGVSGPGQGDNNLNDLYFPGGHFLGISCFKPEVNIKSCVNLSRVCEIGTNLSQFKDIVSKVNVDNGTYEIEHVGITPNGLVSKYDISDGNFRNIFATLNNNGLKTKKDTETNYRKYDFRSGLVYNFDGSLSNNVTNESYETAKEIYSFSGEKQKDVYSVTGEELNKDYYCYRLGLSISDLKDAGYVRSKYGIDNKGSVSMPIYNNSFYFYFGIQQGNTAYDRFLNDFYAICPDDEFKNPAIEVSDIIDTKVCNDKTGSAYVQISGLGSAYKIKLQKQNEIDTGVLWETQKIKWVSTVIEPDDNGTETIVGAYKKFYIGKNSAGEGFQSGTYRIILVTFDDNKEWIKQFTIGTETPTELVPIIESMEIVQFTEEVYYTGNRKSNTSDKNGYIEIYIPNKYIGFVTKIDVNIDEKTTIVHYDKEVTTGITTNNKSFIDVQEKKDEDGNVVGRILKMYVNEGNVNYYINYTILCNEIEQSYNTKEGYYVYMPAAFHYYFIDSSVTDKKIIDALNNNNVHTYKNLTVDNVGTTTWYTEDEYLSKLDPTELWYLEKDLTYRDSMFNKPALPHSISIVPYGGEIPYTNEVKSGHGEKYDSTNGKYVLKDYCNTDTDKTYSVDYENFMFPTKIIEHGNVSNNDRVNYETYIKKLDSLGIANREDCTYDMYDYEVELHDNNN